MVQLRSRGTTQERGKLELAPLGSWPWPGPGWWWWWSKTTAAGTHNCCGVIFFLRSWNNGEMISPKIAYKMNVQNPLNSDVSCDGRPFHLFSWKINPFDFFNYNTRTSNLFVSLLCDLWGSLLSRTTNQMMKWIFIVQNLKWRICWLLSKKELLLMITSRLLIGRFLSNVSNNFFSPF